MIFPRFGRSDIIVEKGKKNGALVNALRPVLQAGEAYAALAAPRKSTIKSHDRAFRSLVAKG